MPDDGRTTLDQRLPILRARDVILSALQATFAKQDLFDGKPNPYLFIPEDPGRSRLWISTPEGRLKFSERDGSRRYITVARGDYTPGEHGQHNYSHGSWGGGQAEFMDLGHCTLLLQCEAGGETDSEILASISYFALKLFRQQLMEQYDITNIHMLSVSPATQQEQVEGKPWISIVALRLEVEEHSSMLAIGNRLNDVKIDAFVSENRERVVASLDATGEFA